MSKYRLCKQMAWLRRKNWQLDLQLKAWYKEIASAWLLTAEPSQFCGAKIIYLGLGGGSESSRRDRFGNAFGKLTFPEWTLWQRGIPTLL